MLSYNTNFIFVLYVGTKLLDKKIYNTKELILIQFHGIAKRINLKPILACPRPSTNANKKPSKKKDEKKKEIAPKREREKKKSETSHNLVEKTIRNPSLPPSSQPV